MEEATPETRFRQSITQLASETETLFSGIRRKTNPPAARRGALRGTPQLCWQGGAGSGVHLGVEARVREGRNLG